MATPRTPLEHPSIHQPNIAQTLRELVHVVWANRWVGFTVAGFGAAMTGILMAQAMPRGPLTTTEALLLLATGFVTGILAGFVMRSPWAMLVAPVIHVIAYEFMRRGTNGPTVDGPHFDSTYGIVAFVIGRGFYGLVGIMPMMVGVAYGAALARYFTHEPQRDVPRRVRFFARRVLGSLSTIGVIALAVLIAWPASVPPVRTSDGESIPGSIAELTPVHLGGHEQWIEIRGASEDLPVMLFLQGGPGQSGLAFSRVFLADLTQDFIIVDWDQRGAGNSRPALDPTSTLTLDQMVADTVELTHYLRDRFDEEKIYLAGESWGTTLGVLAVQKHPELYHAFIGSGQMVCQLETDRRIYQDLLDYAADHGDEGMAKKLREIGEPPYADVFAYGYILTQYDKIEGDYTPPQAYEDLGTRYDAGPFGIFASEYSFVNKVNVLGGLMDVFAVLYPQLQGIDFRQDVPSLAVPIYLLQGEYELAGRADLAIEWFDLVEAPHKQMFVIEYTGHATAFEGFEEFHRIMIEIVVPATYQAH